MSRSIYAPTPEIRRINTVVPISKGGTGASDGPTAVSNLGGISITDIDVANGVAGLDNTGKLNTTSFPVLNNAEIALTGPKTVLTGTLNTYQITNYDSKTTYTVSTNLGTVNINNDIISLRSPNISTTIILNINNDTFTIEVIDNYIVQPTIQAPTNYSSNVPAYTTITSNDLDIATGREVDKLIASDGAAGDAYGVGATVSGDGQWLAVGANADDNAQGTDAGKVYIYQRNGNGWTEVSTITEAIKGLGYGLSFNEDGSKLVVGSAVTSGQVIKVFTYTLINGIPTKVNEFTPSISSEDTLTRPYISKNGLVLAVGLYNHVTSGVSGSGIVYIYDWNISNNTWTYRTSVQEPTLTAVNYFGYKTSLNIDGSVLVVSSHNNDTYGTNAGIVYVYDWNTVTSTYDLRTTVISSDIAAGDRFGYGLDISSDGSMLVVGSIFKDTIASVDAGKVYVYQWNTTTSTFDELYTLEASDVATNDRFGSDVSITNNKDLLVVGTSFNDNANGTHAGAVYTYIPEVHQSSSWELATDPNFTNVIYNSPNDTTNLTSWSVYDLLPATDYYARVMYTGNLYGNSQWSEPTVFTTEQQFLPDVEVNKLIASDGAASDFYGTGITVSGDGQWLAVGANGDDNAQGTVAGKVYIYRRNGDSWTEVSTITEATKRFGFSLSFNEDGSKLVVGNFITSNEISIYGYEKVFTYSLVNGIPTKINEFVPETNNITNWYACSVGITKNGLVLAVGLHGFDTNGIVRAGIVYIYDWNVTNNTWTYRTSVQEPTVVDSNYFGRIISLNNDGSILVVSATDNDIYGTDAGIVYVYDWNTVTSTYDLRTTVISSDIAVGDRYGNGVDISSDGSILVVGSRFKDTIAGTDAGKVYVYQWNTTTSTFDELYTLEASDGAANDQFGIVVSITTNKNLLVVGVRGDDNSNGTDAGAVYTFR